ncbi:Cadherin-87A, partial [Gryllus bimaculatus]
SPPLWSETRVLVRVGVAGNQRPVFRGNHSPASVDGAAASAPAAYRAELPENAAPGAVVVQVAASDPDGQDALLAYHLVAGARDNFAIDHRRVAARLWTIDEVKNSRTSSISGIITVAPDAHLDLETGVKKYEIIVHAVDAGYPIPETATSTVVVNILDVNNKPPVFPSTDPLMYVRYISEATAVGENILNVTAYDPDSDAELRYSIVEPIRATDRTGVALKSTVPFNFKTAFAINSSSGQLSVAHQLEHEAAAVIVLTVQAEDLKGLAEQKTTVEVTVHIQANDDDKPVFTVGGWTPSKPVIHVTVPEERPVGTALLTLAAQDPIRNVLITDFKQVEENDISTQDYFIVGAQSGDVVLNRRLDYETLVEKKITLKVSAISMDRRSSNAVIIIDVEDINDNNPQFTQEMYSRQVPESTKYPDPILVITATDGDTDSNSTGFGSIRYSLSGENARFFVINSTSGVISVAANASLDHERHSSLRFTVVAADTPQGVIHVFVDVLDVNDNAPSFGQESYSAVIPENVPVNTVLLTVSATDPDEGMGGVVSYEFLDEGEANGLFVINKTTGQIITQKPLTGKGRNEPYNLLLHAQDAGEPSLSSDVSLSIYIGDVFSNDGVPTFIRPSLTDIAQISENSSIGSPVFQVVAVDPDAPNTPNGKIIFKFLEDGTDALAFNIDEDSGLISTKKLLDREDRENYTLIIVAQDKGSPPQRATRLLNVRVLDVDDHTPLFQRSLDDGPLLMTLEEEVDIGTKVGYIEAIDKDSGENALIDYSIIDGNELGLFNISRTEDNKGLLTVVKRVDREATAEHILTVKCFKKNLHLSGLRKTYNRQDPSEIQVHIKLEDIDDNKPTFLQDNITVGVRLNVPVDTSLLKLEAIDVDEDPAPIMYHLLNTTFYSLAVSVMDIVSVPADHEGAFQLNNITGDLHTAGSMLPYADGYFDLHIMANNTDIPGMEVYALVKVFVLRDRDLLKFVFSKPPTDVQRDISDFQREVEKALLLPVSLNIYDTQFYAKEDGSLDFSSTSSCFQLVGRENYDLKDMELLMTDDNNSELKQVYKRYGVQNVKHCIPRIMTAEASWVQLWVLAIAAFIAIGAFLSGITVCCLYSRYKRISRKQLLQEMPRATISNVGYLTSAPNSSPMIVGPLPDGPRMYDGLTLPINHDNMSYHSFPS